MYYISIQEADVVMGEIGPFSSRSAIEALCNLFAFIELEWSILIFRVDFHTGTNWYKSAVGYC